MASEPQLDEKTTQAILAWQETASGISGWHINFIKDVKHDNTGISTSVAVCSGDACAMLDLHITPDGVVTKVAPKKKKNYF